MENKKIYNWFVNSGSSFPNITGVQAIYSVRLLNPLYSGPAVRIKNNTSSVEQDFNFVGGVWDTAGIATFLGANVGKVMTIYDQVGSAHMTQSTLANMPFYLASYASNGKPCAFFNRRDASLDHSLIANITTDSYDLAWFGMNSGNLSFFPGTASTDMLYTWGGNPSLVSLSDNITFRTGTKSIGFLVNLTYQGACNISQKGAKFINPGSSSYYHDSFLAESFGALTTRRQPTTAILGKRSNATNKQIGPFQELIVYSSALSSANETALKLNQNLYFGSLTKTNNIVWDGSSLDFGYTSTNAFNEDISSSPGYKTARLIGETAYITIFGTPSATYQSLMAQGNWITRKRMLLDHSSLNNLYIIGGPTNNVTTAESTATITGRIDTLISDIKATAPNAKFVFYTIYSRTDIFANGSFQTVGDQVNDYLLSLASVPNKIWVLDLRASVLGKPSTNAYTNTTYFDADGIHLKPAGYQVVADAMYSFLVSNSLLS